MRTQGNTESGGRTWSEFGMRLLRPAGRIYAAGMRMRSTLYSTWLLGSWKPPRPCISVGNISLGGKGKTPLAQWLLQSAARKNKTPVLLTRGYKASPPYYPFLVRSDSSPSESGDEPLMLARSCKRALVVVDPRRDRGGQWIMERNRPDLFVLDDGMQHLRVERDVDLVLLDTRDLVRDWNMVLPSGPWREGKKALERADAILLNVPPQREEEMFARLRARFEPEHRPVFSFHVETVGLKGLDGSNAEHPPGEPYLLFSGVGSPEGVKQGAADLLGAPPQQHLVYPDHHPFSEGDWERIRRNADSLRCRTIVCTAKDAVKLKGVKDSRIAWLDLRLSFGGSENSELDFPSWLEQSMRISFQGG